MRDSNGITPDAAGAAISTETLRAGTLSTMIGIPVRLRDSLTMDDLGLVHAPQPLEPGDVVSPLEFGPPLQIVAFLQAPYHASFEVATARLYPLVLVQS